MARKMWHRLLYYGITLMCMLVFILYVISFLENSATTQSIRTFDIKALQNYRNSNENLHFRSQIIQEQIQKNIKFFELKIKESDMMIMRKLLHKFIEVVPSNVTYFMMYGTLLGSYRHHGMIPWDADIDFMLHIQHLWTLERAFENLYPEFQFVPLAGTPFIWRFFHEDSHPTKYRWKWPFIDVFLYLEDSDHIWCTAKGKRFDKRLIFPLKRRPFMDYFLLSPNSPLAVLSNNYDLNRCTWTQNLATENYTGPVLRSVPCEYLMEKFPFVIRSRNSTGTLETLVLNGSLVQGHQAFFIEN